MKKIELDKEFEFIHLPKEIYKGTILNMEYESDYYYDVIRSKNKDGWIVSFEKKKFENTYINSSEKYDFPDSLYQDFYNDSYAWGIIEKKTKKLVAAIEINLEKWWNRLRITEMWVCKNYKRRGFGKFLMNIVKEHARLENYRGIILETQSCNSPAINFYISQGFDLGGFNAFEYSNYDIERKEVRLEMYLPILKKEKIPANEITLVDETESMYFECETKCRESFYNKYRPGCNEHLFLHELRKSPLFLPEFSKIAIVSGKIAGGIWYTKGYLKKDNSNVDIEIPVFGPIFSSLEFEGRGIGSKLITETLKLVKNAGYPGVIIYGNPSFYNKFGFKSCDNFNITTPSGENFDAFMGIEFEENSLKKLGGGKFYEIDIEEKLSPQQIDSFDKAFPPLQKFTRPGQF